MSPPMTSCTVVKPAGALHTIVIINAIYLSISALIASLVIIMVPWRCVSVSMIAAAQGQCAEVLQPCGDAFVAASSAAGPSGNAFRVYAVR